jgi:hypothetical protein
MEIDMPEMFEKQLGSAFVKGKANNIIEQREYWNYDGVSLIHSVQWGV